jgi:hypothetical protein
MILEDRSWPVAEVPPARAGGGQRLHSARRNHRGRLVTFDSGIALAAVKGATARELVTLV